MLVEWIRKGSMKGDFRDGAAGRPGEGDVGR